MLPVVLAGGSGTRFWPVSRRDRPKQLLKIFDDRPMVDATVDRVAALSESPTYIICRPSLTAPTTEALSTPSDVEFITEPAPRDTAPAIALATARIEAIHGDEPIAFFPADHYIADQKAFEDCLRFAADRAREDAIVTLGIPPTRPETGYGYIETDACVSRPSGELKSEPVVQFVEKPDRTRALKYLESGNYLWNSGMFLFRPSVLWSELRRQQPETFKQVDRIRTQLATDEPDESIVDDAFEKMEAISIDYAVMEGAETIEVVPATFRWSDVGHWAALDEIFDADDRGNIVRADAVTLDVDDSVLVSYDSDRLIAAIGLDDVVVVDTPDAVLVVPTDRTQQVRDLVARLEELDRGDLT